MSNRARDIGRHYASGSAKRKAKEEKDRKEQHVISKTRKLMDFFDHGDNGVPKAENTTATSEGEASAIIQEQSASNESERTTETNKYSNDLGDWPENLDDCDREYWITKGSDECQHIDSDFSSSKRLYDNEKNPRHCQKSYFTYVHKPSNKQHTRHWLCYSESRGSLFCFPCKVMNSGTSGCSSKFCEEGFNDWKNASNLFRRHEESTSHRQALISLSMRKSKAERVDSKLLKEIETEQKYWHTLLERIVEVVKFLAERGLSFRGSNETVGSPHNGNYLGILELLAKFDPFLAQHINTYANKGRGHTSYLSKTTCEEFINLIGSSILDHIIGEVKKYKYYSISLDSTPDISNVDQLTFTVRYVLPSGPVERFVNFLEMEGHSAEQLTESLLGFLTEHDIDIKDCRGQSYDNASNMSGKYSGVQARIKQLNQSAEYIPCFVHSLNLVGKCAAECCHEALLFFQFVESLYTFFSASTYRWNLLSVALSAGDGDAHLLMVKRLSDTRWSARADATKALLHSYSTIKQILDDMSNNNDHRAEGRQQAHGLLSTMSKLETGILVILWDQVLQRFHMTSSSLQSSSQDLNTACALYGSLYGYIQSLRPCFSDIEQKARNLTGCDYHQKARRERKRNRAFDDFAGSSAIDPVAESQTHSQVFESQTFLVIIDNLLSALSKRQKAYEQLNHVCGFLHKVHEITPDEIIRGSSRLVSAYPEDLEECLGEEFIQFSELVKSDVFSHIGAKQDAFELRLYRLIVENSLGTCFPNVETALRIFLSLMVTNCSGERSFSKLKRIKNELRSTMGQTRLNDLSLMSIEHELLREIDISKIINKFAQAKARKCNF